MIFMKSFKLWWQQPLTRAKRVLYFFVAVWGGFIYGLFLNLFYFWLQQQSQNITDLLVNSLIISFVFAMLSLFLPKVIFVITFPITFFGCSPS